jgi:thioredoxin reductase (NADPH)
VQVRCNLIQKDFRELLNVITGSGCIAALEAEKWLAEQDETPENPLEGQKVGKSQKNNIVPQYRSNPLL